MERPNENNNVFRDDQIQLVRVLISAKNSAQASGELKSMAGAYGIPLNQKWEDLERQVFGRMGIVDPSATITKMVEDGLIKAEAVGSGSFLSARQADVVLMRLLNISNEEISERLGVGQPMVRGHIAGGCDRMGISYYGLVAAAAEDKHLFFARSAVSIVEKGLVKGDDLPAIGNGFVEELSGREATILSLIILEKLGFVQIGQKLKTDADEIKIIYREVCARSGQTRLMTVVIMAAKLNRAGRL